MARGTASEREQQAVTFIKRLGAHKGGLIRLKTQLFWYNVMPVARYDRSPGRVCLLLEATAVPTWREFDAPRADADTANADMDGAMALLLIDGMVKWVRVAEGDVELL